MKELNDTIRTISIEIQGLYGQLQGNPGDNNLHDSALYAEMDNLVAERRVLEAARKLMAKWN